MTHRLVGLLALTVLGCTKDEETDTPDLQVFEACEGREFAITDPNPYIAWTPSAVTLQSEELAEGVFAVYDSTADVGGPAGFPLATSGGFVIGDDGVALVETMWTRQLLCQVYDLVRAETDLPVLYAVNTSHHGDHNFGNTFLPDDVQVVQHEHTADYLAENFDQEVAFAESGFGTDQGFEEAAHRAADIEVGEEGWSVDLGGITLEARYYGFGQTDGDLFFFVPGADVLWTGNPLTAEEPAIPWMLEGGASAANVTLAAVQASMPSAAVVVPGHGRPVTPTAFTFSIDYLDTLVTEVQASVDAGDTLEEAQGTVVMEDFQGYAAWDFAHTMVNVPATFAELSQ